MVALYRQMHIWRNQNSPEWQWHERYMSNCYEGGAHLKLGPETVAKRWGFVQAAERETTKQIVVFTSSGTEYALDEQKGTQMLKRMSDQLKNCKWIPSALADSQGTTSRVASSSYVGAGHPSTARADVETIMKQHRTICQDVLKLGLAIPDLRIGADSNYIRPHVCRKLFLALMHVSGWTFRTFPWRKLKMDDLLALGPDMHGYVSDAPAHWRHKGVDLYSNMDADAGKQVPLVMHGCWACLFGYATSSTYGSGMGDTAVRFIQEGHGEEFERCARALCVALGVQPTPSKVSLLRSGVEYSAAGEANAAG